MPIRPSSFFFFFFINLNDIVFEEERMFCIAGLLKFWEAFWDDFITKPIFDTKKTTSKQLWTIQTNSLKIYIKAAKLIRKRVFVWLVKVAMWRTTQSKGLAFNQEKPFMSKSNNFFNPHSFQSLLSKHFNPWCFKNHWNTSVVHQKYCY